MSSAVAELETGLQAMLGLKPPGVSGSRITSITALCVGNVQFESVLIQKIYTHFKKTPGTHKLGVLYVVDSVTRKWMEQAKAQGQPISSAAQDGTFAAGVHRVTELMPVLMNDIISSAPEDQKEKIRKLVDIWEKGQTFPTELLTSFKEKLNAPPPPDTSTTPPGSPPVNMMGPIGSSSKSAAPPTVPSNIMEALANIARQSTSAVQSNASLAAPTPTFSLPGTLSNAAAQAIPAPAPAPPQPTMAFLPASQPAVPPIVPPVSMPTLPFTYPPQAQQGQVALAGALNVASSQPSSFPANPAPQVLPNAALDPKVQQQLVLIQTLAAQGIPFDKITSIIAQVMGGSAPAAPAPSVPSTQMPQPTQSSYAGPSPWEAPRTDESRDRNGYHESLRSPNLPRGRSRSRSPRGWGSRGSPHGRGSDRGYHYGHNSPGGRGRGGGDDRDRERGRDSRGNDYRQRSPASRRDQSPDEREPPHIEKWIEYDPSLPTGHIKVLSRTLFVGGVTCSESELRQIFSRHGQVQTCIVNKDKRHAFVKMYLRKDAVHAKEAMEEARHHDLPLRTRWGVGFGPRDCSDYATGISVIPIHKLTEADKKWMLTAPFGGSGGRPIVSGLCVEEPDIEIGAGVSSKAISRRMQTDKGGNHGPKSSKREEEVIHSTNQVSTGGGGGGGGGSSAGRWRRGHRENRDNRRDERSDRGSANEEPVILGFPPGITMGPNGINFPPGFTFPASGTNNA